ncbi:phytanoyl-CoA dioxygenase family protein [Sphingobium vermicomposti]|uniref:Phytanoyl-CoA dioxygenase n=1 Tax=Sphingobium vermicomposti TaxID=529005 RepID=A0A846MAQ0_9SPHN|nr:phytanoyl-CoA dioxygenase family protein [Sphingobium vermicomposti]NIJ17901.1 hypothetical protein [Sphingobium vermicomposti]
MTLQHLPNTATVEEATEVLREHGYVIIDQLVPASVTDQVLADLLPFAPKAQETDEEWGGNYAYRIGKLIARSQTGRDLVMNPLVLGVVKNILTGASTFQLCTTELISLNPGAPAQVLHTDELLYDDFVFPDDCVACCNTLWAITDYTEENGATRIVPGSHARPPANYTIEDTVPAEMSRGSVLIFSGKLWHAAGSNRSTEVRRSQAINYSLGWLRQGENQYLACPPETARTLPEDLLKVMGYQVGPKYGYGHVGAQADPLQELLQA